MKIGIILVKYLFFEVLAAVSGFGAATVAFTAFIIMIPFLLNIVELPLHGTLFISVWVDFVNSVFLIIRYSCSQDIHYRFALFGISLFPISLATSMYLSDYILNKFSFLIKRSSSVALFLMSFMYFVRFFVFFLLDIRKRRKERNLRKKKSIVISESTSLTIQPIENLDKYQSVIQSSDSDEESDDDDNEFKINKECLKSNISTCGGYYQAFMTSNRPLPWILRNSAFVFFSFLLSMMSGIGKMSGGTCFMILFRNLYNKSLLNATGTGIFVSFWIISGSMTGLLIDHFHELMTNEILIYCGMATVCTLLGAFLGSSIMVVLSDYMAFLFVAINFLGLGIATSVVSHFAG